MKLPMMLKSLYIHLDQCSTWFLLVVITQQRGEMDELGLHYLTWNKKEYKQDEDYSCLYYIILCHLWIVGVYITSRHYQNYIYRAGGEVNIILIMSRCDINPYYSQNGKIFFIFHILKKIIRSMVRVSLHLQRRRRKGANKYCIRGLSFYGNFSRNLKDRQLESIIIIS